MKACKQRLLQHSTNRLTRSLQLAIKGLTQLLQIFSVGNFTYAAGDDTMQSFKSTLYMQVIQQERYNDFKHLPTQKDKGTGQQLSVS